MPNQKDRVVVDTNLWISFLLTKNYSKLDILFSQNRLLLIFSQELIEEFIEVVQRTKFKKYFTLSDLQSLLLEFPQKTSILLLQHIITKGFT